MIVLGADTHKHSHTIAAVTATGELRGEQIVQVGRRGLDGLLRWARGLDGERVWARSRTYAAPRDEAPRPKGPFGPLKRLRPRSRGA